MIKLLLLASFCLPPRSHAQELFTYSEPASNMPVKSFAVRANNYLMRESLTGKYSYAVSPEVMAGLSKKLMLHGEVFFGMNPERFRMDGASVYAKYRFYSQDDVHSHFRIAAYGKIAVSALAFMQPAIDLFGRNSGGELGAVATKLSGKSAISLGTSVIKAFGRSGNKDLPPNEEMIALNYNLSGGRLVIPVSYKSYDQVNVNLMMELLGQTNLGSGSTFVDVAPSVQFILKSKVRVDAGYRWPVVTSLHRQSDRAFLLRLEYNFFSVFR